MIGQTLGSYRIVRRLSRGGMGEVFEAEHSLIGRKAAIKLLQKHVSRRSETVDRFFNEARATAAIGHPGIIEIFDFGFHDDGRAYLIMEFLEGEPLSKRIKREGKLDIEWSITMLDHVASALSAAHKKGIIHRDLKPDNIFLVADPGVAFGERPKLLDFGIAKIQHEEAGSVKTRTGMVMGTPEYMAPEQCRGAGEVDHRADLYSLGCIFFELLTGQVPLKGVGVGETIGMHQFKDAPMLRAVDAAADPAAEELIHRLLAKEPDDRLQSTEEFAIELSVLRETLKHHGHDSGPEETTTPGDMVSPLATARAQTDKPMTLGRAPSVHPPQPGRAPTAHPERGVHTPTPHPAVMTPTPHPASMDGLAGTGPQSSPALSPPGYDAVNRPGSQMGITGAQPAVPGTGEHSVKPTTLGGAAAEQFSTLPPAPSKRRWPVIAGVAGVALALAVVAIVAGGDSGTEQAQAVQAGDDTATAVDTDPADEQPTASAETDEQPGVLPGEIRPGDAKSGDAKSGDGDTAPTPSEDKITLVIETTPTGAEVRRAGTEKVLDKTPFTYRATRDSGSVDFEVSHKGYEAQKIAFATTGDDRKHVELKRKKKATAKAPKKKRRTVRKKPADGKKGTSNKTIDPFAATK